MSTVTGTRTIRSSRAGQSGVMTHFCPLVGARIEHGKCVGCNYFSSIKWNTASYEISCLAPVTGQRLINFEPARAQDKTELPAYLGDDPLKVATHSWYEPKRDGARAIAHFIGGKIYFTGRRKTSDDNGYAQFTDNVPHLRDMPYPAELEGMVLDCEIMCLPAGASASGNVPAGTLGATMSVVGATPAKAIFTQKQTGWAHLYVFDMPFGPMQEDLRRVPLKMRRQRLEEIFHMISDEYVHLMEYTILSDYESRKQYFELSLQQGHEGCVAKDPLSLYGIGYGWLKVKQTITLDCLVTGFEYGTRGGKYEKQIGALLLSVIDVNSGRLVEIAKCVPGSDAKRAELTDKFHSVLEKGGHVAMCNIVVELEAQTWTKNNRVRHPRLLRYRTDKVQLSRVDFTRIEKH